MMVVAAAVVVVVVVVVVMAAVVMDGEGGTDLIWCTNAPVEAEYMRTT
jgi:hypothetical protein